MMVNLELHHRIQDGEPLWSAWRELSGGLPLRQPEWLMSWWENCAPKDASLHVLAAFDAGRLVGLAPCYRSIADRQIRLLGNGRTCTDYNGVLIAPEVEAGPVLRAMVDWWLSHASDRDIGWDTLYWEGIAADDTLTRGVQQSLDARGCMSMERNPMQTWCVDLTGGWESFLARCSKDTRRRLRRRLDSLRDTETRWVHCDRDWDRFYPILMDLHQRRRNALGDPGCFADAPFVEFVRTAARRLLSRGQLQAFHIEKDGQPISADIGFRSASHWYCYQSGIEPAALDIEPGKMANVWILSQAERQGVQVVDFLRGDEPYKKQLKANPKPMSDLWISRPGWKGRSQKLLWQSRRWIADTARHVYQTLPLSAQRG